MERGKCSAWTDRVPAYTLGMLADKQACMCQANRKTVWRSPLQILKGLSELVSERRGKRRVLAKTVCPRKIRVSNTVRYENLCIRIETSMNQGGFNMSSHFLKKK